MTSHARLTSLHRCRNGHNFATTAMPYSGTQSCPSAVAFTFDCDVHVWHPSTWQANTKPIMQTIGDQSAKYKLDKQGCIMWHQAGQSPGCRAHGVTQQKCMVTCQVNFPHACLVFVIRDANYGCPGQQLTRKTIILCFGKYIPRQGGLKGNMTGDTRSETCLGR